MHQSRVHGWWSCLLLVATLLLSPPANAQSRVVLRGFGDVGWTTFAADQSFSAVLGSDTGRAFGGGVDVVLPRHVFVTLRASRFRDVGQRVFLFDGRQFDLGIPTTITITPLELTAGYRFDRGWRSRALRRRRHESAPVRGDIRVLGGARTCRCALLGVPRTGWRGIPSHAMARRSRRGTMGDGARRAR